MVVSDNGAEMLKPEDIAQRMTSVERNGERIWNKDSEEELPTEEEQSTEDNGVLPKQEDDKQQGADGKDNSDDGSLTPPTTDELIEMARQGNELAQYQLEAQGISWEDTNEKKADDKNQSALARIPKDNDGSPIYEQTDADTAWDAIVEQTDGDEDMAQSVADSMVSDKEKALHDVENEEIAQSGSVADKIAAAKQHKQNVDNAKAELEHWKEIAGTLERRKQSAEQSDEDSNAPQNDNVPKEQNDAEPQTGNINVPQSDEEPIEQVNESDVPQTDSDKDADKNAKQGDVENSTNDDKKTNTSADIEEKFNSFVGQLKSAKGEERKRVLEQMRDIITQYAEENGYPVPEYWLTTEDYLNHASPKDREKLEKGLANGFYNPGTYRLADHKVYIYVEGCNDFDRCVRMTLAHEYTHADNDEVQDGINTIVEAVKKRDVTLDELLDILWNLSNNDFYEEEYDRLEAKGKDKGLKMLADEVIAHIVARMVVNGKQALNEITQNPTISRVVTISYNRREDARRFSILQNKTPEWGGSVVSRTEGDNANQGSTKESEPRDGRHGRSVSSQGHIGSSEESKDGAIAETEKDTNAIPKEHNDDKKPIKPTENRPKETKQKNSGQFGLVSDERMEELKRKLRTKLNGQLNVGIDPEILTIAAELATGYIDRGLKAFGDFAKAMIDDIGDVARPYIKMSYNAARDWFEENKIPLYEEMTPYEEVKRFDVANYGREHVDTIEQAKQIANEQKVEEQAKKIKGEKTSEDKGDTPLSTKIATASTEVNTEPTEAQKEAGNYKKGHVQVGTFDITIEQPEGSVRKGTDANGKQWESKMHNTYGYFRGTEGVDGDHIDVFLSNYIDDWNGRKVYVVDQYNPDGTFDEHKVMLGFNDMDEAKSDYLANYEKGWEDGRRIVVSATNLEDFEKWIGSSHRKTKPFAEYAGVKKDVAQIEQAKAKADTTEIDKAIAKAEAEGNTELLKKLKAEKAFCEKHIPEKGDKKVGYKKQKDTLNITSIVNGKEVRAQLRGIHYENGFAVATDGYTMVITRQEYPTEYEGKTIGKNGEAIDLKFPIWVNAIPMLNSDEYSRSELEDVLKDASKRYKEFKKKYKEEHPEAKTKDVENEMVEYEIDHQILLDKESGINVTDANLLLNILEWCGEEARVFKFKGKYYTLVFIKSKGAYALMMTRIAEDRQESDTRLIGKAKPIAETTEETKQPILEKEEKPANANNKKKKKEASKPTDNKDKEAPQDKIDDVGEKIEGARKDALKKLAESIEQATEEALVAMPFSKAFKRPNLKKAVEDGVLREEDALFAQAVMSAYLSRKKPLMSKSRSSYDRERSEKTIKVWAHHAYNGVEKLKKLFSLSPSERDTFMMEEMNRPAYDPKDVEKRKQDLMEWNPGKVFNGTCYPINAIRLWNDVYTQLGYEVGTEVPQLFSEVLPTTGYDSYVLVAANGTKFYPARSLNSYNAVVDEIVYQTKVANADADTDHPKETFKVIGSGEMKTKSSGKWYVVTQASLSAKPHKDIFSSKEEAEKFAKAYIKNDGKKVNKYRYASAPEEVREFDGYSEYAVVLRRKNIGKGTTTDFKLKHYNTADEARAAIDAEHDELNELANKELAKDKGSKSASTKKPICSIEVYTEDGKSWKYGIVLSDKYAPKKSALNTMPYYLAKDFNTRKEAQAYLDAHKEEIEAKAAEVDEARRNFKYFTANGEREGNDYRKGEDVTAEQFREQFGFRGVQFGNWTNQRDRQEAVNQAFDAFMDLSRILGVSPKALSLNGELGIAFGARGSGKALAHYEPSQVVINLTKTNGAGSLAHEWWHALDNYFARQGNVAMGFVTQSKNIEMRDELRQAFNTLIDHLEKSPYNQRSKQRGSSYWGTPIEETARMFEQWVNDQLAQRGEKSPFLTDADPYIEERYAQMNYEMYKFFMGDKAMPYEEYKQTPQALNGLVYLTRDELQTFGKDLKHIFDTIQQKVDETTGKTLMYHKGDVVFPLNHVETTLRDVVIEHLRKNGFNVITDVRTGQRVIELAKGEARLSAKQKRALETASVPLDKEHQPTVVSSADGAKILNNLDTLANDFEKLSNTPKSFIGNVAKALGTKRYGSSSEYATFETKNGQIVTIRLANHNAHTSGFDHNDRDNGISIVISPKGNNGIINDGNAHVVEFYYDAIKLRRANGKPLADIVRSIKQALYSGEFKDPTGIAERQEVNTDTIREHRVWHGSGADFDHFDHSHMGEGEGAQAYGWGTYVTEVKGIGKAYAVNNSHLDTRKIENEIEKIYGIHNIGIKNVELKSDGTIKRIEISNNRDILEEWLKYFSKHNDEFGWPDVYDFDLSKSTERDEFIHLVELAIADKVGDRFANGYEQMSLYTIEIPDDTGKNYLDYKKRCGLHLLNRINKALKKVGLEAIDPKLAASGVNGVLTGRDVYQALSVRLKEDSNEYNNDKNASQFLSDLGIIGIKYPAEYRSGGRNNGSNNYVIFNEKDLKITDHVRFFRTTDGEAYGFTYGGDIYIDPSIASSETPIHEYAHLWASALRAENKKEWKNVVDLMKGTSVWDEVKRTYPELKTDDDIADEVLATYSGRRGAELLRKEMDKAMSEGTATEKGAAVSALQRVKQAIEKFWHAVADFLHIHYTSAEQVADQVMKDLLDGVDPREFTTDLEYTGTDNEEEDEKKSEVSDDELMREGDMRNPNEMSESEKAEIGNALVNAPTIDVASNQIVKTEDMSARKAAEKWWRDNIGEPLFYDTEVGVVEINENSIGTSLAHRYGQAKLDAITSLKDGFKNAVYLGTIKDFIRTEKSVLNHYFAYPINYNGKRCYVFCRAMQDNNKNRLYVHEVFVADNIQEEGNTLQTAAQKPHGGIALYKAILSDALNAANVGNNSELYNFSNEKDEVRQSQERITLPTSVQEQVEAMHLGGEVEVIADGSQFKGKKRKAKGFYNKQTGKITIILGNHTSVEDVMQTLMHEAVAHKGLRKLFGKDFDAFLDKVFAGAEKPIREKIVALAAKNGWNIRTATEEYLASLAEDKETFEKHGGFWEKVRNFFYEMAHKLFPKLVKIGDNEMRYELWRSYENLKNDSSLIAEAKDIAMQDKLKVGNYAEKQGNTFDEDAMLYREERERVDAKHDYEMAMKSASHKFVTAWADSMYSLKQLQDIICKNGNTQIADWENAYMAENRMSSINLAEMETYKKTFYKDMLDAIQSLMKGGVKYQDVVTYMYAKHGLERNKYIQDEEIGKLQQAFLDKYGEKPISRPNDFTSGIDRNDYASDDAYNKACQAAVDAAQKKYDEAAKKLNKKIAKIASSDYSGLSSLFNTNSGFKTAAQQYVSDFEKGRQISRSTHRHQFEFDC